MILGYCIYIHTLITYTFLHIGVSCILLLIIVININLSSITINLTCTTINLTGITINLTSISITITSRISLSTSSSNSKINNVIVRRSYLLITYRFPSLKDIDLYSILCSLQN